MSANEPTFSVSPSAVKFFFATVLTSTTVNIVGCVIGHPLDTVRVSGINL